MRRVRGGFLEEEKVLIAGSGGQGIVFLGKLIAEAAIMEEKNVTYIRSYGAEMRGGAVYAKVRISSEEIASPVFAFPTLAIIMNQLSWERFKEKFKRGTKIFLNSSVVKKDSSFKKFQIFACPFNEIADSLGDVRVANIVSLGVCIKRTGLIKKSSVRKVLGDYFSSSPGLYKLNLKALQEGWQRS